MENAHQQEQKIRTHLFFEYILEQVYCVKIMTGEFF